MALLFKCVGDTTVEKFDFNPYILRSFFDNKVREQCKICKRYGQKATCPPHMESVEYYRKVLSSYRYGVLFVLKYAIDDISNWKVQGRDSSLLLHNALLEARNELFAKGKFGIVFGAGSCKLCETCNFPCRFPDKSVAPLEATGLNVIAMVKEIANIELKFPVESQSHFYRIGAVLYD